MVRNQLSLNTGSSFYCLQITEAGDAADIKRPTRFHVSKQYHKIEKSCGDSYVIINHVPKCSVLQYVTTL
jgi:hypothetical protein